MNIFRDRYLAALKAPIENRIYELVGLFNVAQSSYEVGLIYNEIGTVYRIQGDYPKAIDSFNRALENIGDNNENLVIRMNIAETYRLNGNLVDCISILDATKALTKENTIEYSYLLNYYGHFYLTFGDVVNALKSYESSLAILINLKADQEKIATAMQNIGKLYLVLGEIESALSYYNDAKLIYDNYGLSKGHHYAILLINESIAYNKIGNNDLAKANIDKAKKIFIDKGIVLNNDELAQFEKICEDIL